MRVTTGPVSSWPRSVIGCNALTVAPADGLKTRTVVRPYYPRIIDQAGRKNHFRLMSAVRRKRAPHSRIWLLGHPEVTAHLNSRDPSAGLRPSVSLILQLSARFSSESNGANRPQCKPAAELRPPAGAGRGPSSTSSTPQLSGQELGGDGGESREVKRQDGWGSSLTSSCDHAIVPAATSTQPGMVVVSGLTEDASIGGGATAVAPSAAPVWFVVDHRSFYRDPMSAPLWMIGLSTKPIIHAGSEE